jgi:hypothetical protein
MTGSWLCWAPGLTCRQPGRTAGRPCNCLDERIVQRASEIVHDPAPRRVRNLSFLDTYGLPASMRRRARTAARYRPPPVGRSSRLPSSRSQPVTGADTPSWLDVLGVSADVARPSHALGCPIMALTCGSGWWDGGSLTHHSPQQLNRIRPAQRSAGESVFDSHPHEALVDGNLRAWWSRGIEPPTGFARRAWSERCTPGQRGLSSARC